MRRFEVELHGRQTSMPRLHLAADTPAEAVMLARAYAPATTDSDVYAVYRHRRVRRRRLVGYFAGGEPGGDGLAGVREPRRPLPDPGHLMAERDPED